MRCHVSRGLTPADRTTIDGIPVTSVERTPLDLASTLSLQRLRSTLEAAQRRDLLYPARIEALLARTHGHRGAAKLRRAMALLHEQAPWTQSELERRFLELIRAAGLPEPQCNVLVEGYVVDFYWPQYRLVVEVDGYAFHKQRRSFESDRQKDIALQLAGIRVARVTHERIVTQPTRLITELRGLIASALIS